MVNTFLPYKSFRKSAQVLDNKRIFKQIVECKQILNILTNKTKKKGYRNHPIVAMWKGHEKALKLYQTEMLKEWAKRRWDLKLDFKDNSIKNPKMPKWIGNRKFHKSHKSNLLRKDKKHYSKYFKNTPDNLPYKWFR